MNADTAIESLIAENTRLKQILFSNKKNASFPENLEIQFSFLDNIINQLTNYVFLKDAKNLSYVRVNKLLEDFLGVNHEDLVGKTDFDLFPEIEARAFTEIDRLVLASGKLNQVEREEVFSKKYGLRIMRTKKIPIYGTNGKPTYLLGIAEDITEKVEDEQRFKKSQANLIALTENTKDSMWSVDTNFCIMAINSNFKNYFQLAFGFKLNPGDAILDFLPEPYKAIWQKRYQTCLDGKSHTVLDQFEFAGVPQFVEATFTPIKIDEKIIGVSCYSKDISEHKRTELELIDREQALRYISFSIEKMLAFKSVNELYTYLATTLQKFFPDTLTIAIKVDEKNQLVDVIHLAGLEGSLFTKISNLLGYNPLNKTFKLSKSYHSLYSQGKLSEIKGGLVEFSDGHISPKIAAIFQKLLGIKKIYSIGITRDTRLYAVIHFLSRSNEELAQKGFIETIVRQTGLIAEKKMLEDALKTKEEKFRFLTENSNVVIWSIDLDFNYTYLSPEIENVMGYSMEERLKKNFRTHYSKKSLEIIDRNLNEMLNAYSKDYGTNTKRSFEVETFHKNGTLLYLEVMIDLIKSPDGIPIGIIGNTRDISNRVRKDQEIRKLYTAIEQSPTAIAITDTNGIIEYINPRFSEATGYSQVELIGGKPNVLKSGLTENKVYEDLWKTIQKGKVWQGEFINKKKNGELYWEHAHIAPIFNNLGDLVNYVAIKEDITHRKKAEESLLKSELDLRELNEQKDKFFSILAHDLRNSVGNFVQITELLSENEDMILGESEQKFVTMLNGMANKTFNLLENLLLWAKSQLSKLNLQPEPILLKPIFKEVCDLYLEAAAKKEIRIKILLSDEIQVFADNNSVMAVVRNLISNAIKFSHSGGTIEISTKISSTKNQTTENVICIVRDYGVGISTEKIDDLFKIFKYTSTRGTANEKGTGLGLALCRELLEKNRGQLYIQSELGKGTEVSFSLPLSSGY